MGPLVAILMLSMLKQGLEDWKRHKADDEMNNRRVNRLIPKGNGATEEIFWYEVAVGDILKVMDHQEFAADCVLLASSEEEGRCFTETANLDGKRLNERCVDFVCSFFCIIIFSFE